MCQQNKESSNVVAIITMFALFFMIAFVTNFAASMGVIAKAQFQASNALSQFGNAANFIAYLFMGIPGGLILKRKGYKFTALVAVAVGFTGLAIQLLSGYIASFAVYVAGAFIAGFSMCMLNLVTNPLLNTLGGGGNKGNQLVQFGCSLNSVGATLSPIVLGILIGEITKDTAFANAAPALMIAMGIFAAAFLIVALSRIPEPHMETAEEKALRLSNGSSVIGDLVATLKFPHFTLGALAIFFYIVIAQKIEKFTVKYNTVFYNLCTAVCKN
jgi:FHS family L-fucose permease-like MFS transporter